MYMLVIAPTQITIPNVDTTYFCQPFELDEDLIATERYIVKVSYVQCSYCSNLIRYQGFHFHHIMIL